MGCGYFFFFYKSLSTIKDVVKKVNSRDEHYPRSYAHKKAIWKAGAKSNKNMFYSNVKNGRSHLLGRINFYIEVF